MSRFVKSFSFFGCLSLVFSVESSTISSIQEQMDTLEVYLSSIEKETALNTNGVVLADSFPKIENSKGIRAEIDLLYFKTQLGGTGFAYSNTYSENSYPIHANVLDLAFPMNLGVRVDLEKQLEKSRVNLDAAYTHFDTNCSESKESIIPTSQIPTKGVLLIGEGAAYAKSSADITWNDLSLSVNKGYFISSSFLMKPLFGLKSSWIDLRQWSRYTGGPNLGQNSVHVHDQSTFFGIGPEIGTSAEWFLGEGFSLAGLLDLGLEYGYYKIRYRENRSNVSSDSIAINQAKHQFSFIVDLGLDLNYGFYFEEQKGYARFSLGYEAIFFLRQNQMLQLFDAYSYRMQNISEDLSFYGLVFKGAILF